MKFYRRTVEYDPTFESPQEVRDRLRSQGKRAFVDLRGQVIMEIPKCVCHTCSCCHKEDE